MPELKKRAASGAMYGIGDATPAGHLVVGIDAGCVGTARTLLRNRCGFRDDEARRCSLGIVRGHLRRWYPAWAGAHPREWSHQNSVRRLNGAYAERGEEGGSIHSLITVMFQDEDIGGRRSTRGLSW